MERKSDAVRRLVKVGEYKKALAIAKDFKLGITKEQSDAMRRGYESIVHPDFYRSLGMDISQTARKGIETVVQLYGV